MAEFVEIWGKAHRKIADAIDEFDGMQIQANNRADCLAKLGVLMHPDNRVRRHECYNDAKVHVQIMKYMTKCLAYTIDQGIYKELQGQHLEFVSENAQKFVPGSLDHKHFSQPLRLRLQRCDVSSAFHQLSASSVFSSAPCLRLRIHVKNRYWKTSESLKSGTLWDSDS